MKSSQNQLSSLSEVSNFLSNFSVNLSNGECIQALSHILVDVSNILSEINIIVKLVKGEEVNQQQQQQQVQQDDFWWDSSDEYFNYNNSDHFSFLSEDVNLCDVSDYSTTSQCYFSSESSISSRISSDSNTTYINTEGEMRMLEDEIFIDSILDLCDIQLLLTRYSTSGSLGGGRRHKRMHRKIHYEFRSIWSHSASIVSPVEKSPINEPRYPCVDWSKVNKRFVDNVPPPTMIPVQGCSPVADVSKSPDYINMKYPYGLKAGYKTNLGVIPVPDELVAHGHVFVTGEGWVLHAKYPQGKSERIGRRRSPFSRPRGKSKREPRQPATSYHASAQYCVSACCQ